MKPLDLVLPAGYHYRVRCSGYARGVDGGIVHVAVGDDAESIAATVKDVEGNDLRAICGTRVTWYTGFNHDTLSEHERNKEPPWTPRITPQKVCGKCVARLKAAHVLNRTLTDEQVCNALAGILRCLQICGPSGAVVKVDGRVEIAGGALTDIRQALMESLGLECLCADAQMGSMFREAVDRGRRLHPWEGHTHMLEAIESEVAELKEAHDVGDEAHRRAEALDVVVTAYRYFEGR